MLNIPGSPVIRIWHFHCCGQGSTPGWKTKILQAVWCSPKKKYHLYQSVQFSGSVVSDSLTAWTAACQASLSITNSQSLLNLMSIELVMPSNHLVLCHPLLPPPSILPNIRVFSSESVHCIRWPKYRSFSFSISPFNEYSGLIPLGWTGWISFQSKGRSRVFSNTAVQKHQFFGAQLSL